MIKGKQVDTPWIDYSGTSTITGWTGGSGAYTTKLLQYTIIGKVMYVQFQIEGNGNGTSVSFTLPQNVASWGTQYFVYHSRNNTTHSASICWINASSNIVTFSNSISTNIAWTSAVTRDIQGMLVISLP